MVVELNGWLDSPLPPPLFFSFADSSFTRLLLSNRSDLFDIIFRGIMLKYVRKVYTHELSLTM